MPTTGRRRGIALIWVVLTMFGFLALAGLAMDLSIAVYSKQKLQNAADAAALAGAALVKTDIALARDKAQQVSLANTVYGTPVTLSRNDGNSEEDGDIVVGYYDRDTFTFTPDEVSPNAMRVMARRTADTHGAIPLVFGPLASKPDVDAWAEAIAIVHGGTGAGLIVLDPGEECAADIRGTGNLNVTDITKDPPDLGAIQVNSDDCGRGAICTNGTVSIEAGEINIVGCADPDVYDSIDDPDKVHTDEPEIPDPLAGLPPIDPGGMSVIPIPSGSGIVGPVPAGYHPGEVKRTGGSLTLEAGVHVFDSGELDPTKKSSALEVTGGDLTALGGVLLYILRGSLTLEGNGTVRLDGLDQPAGTSEAAYNGITIFQARTNSSPSKITGTNGLDLSGTLYFPNNPVEIRGEGDGFGNQLIAWQLTVVGTGEIKIMYDGRNPAPGNDVFLVR